jgi:hypothetical protein
MRMKGTQTIFGAYRTQHVLYSVYAVLGGYGTRCML